MVIDIVLERDEEKEIIDFLKNNNILLEIEFYDKDNNKIIKIPLEFNLFADGLLETVCKQHNIEINILTFKTKK